MPMNRVQFQAGLSMAEFYERYGTEEQVPRRRCRRHAGPLALSARPAGCGAHRFVRGGLRYWQCGACGTSAA